MKLEIYDSTLREGEQSATVSFSKRDKIKIIKALDTLGVSYIEAGMVTLPEDLEFFGDISRMELKNARPVAFGATIRPGEDAQSSPSLSLLASVPCDTVCVFGKSWDYQVSKVLSTTKDENLRMIADSISYLRSKGKTVFFDAEHFFDGYSDDARYAMSVLETARDAGAERIILCDTNGGMLPDIIGMATAAVTERFGKCVGIHCHNDLGMAEACTVSAVLSGAVQVQGTVSGIGERCGNANLNTLIPILQLKLGFECIGEKLSSLTSCARYINETANRIFDEREPFVGGYAFTHKAGMHIDGVMKSPRTFEHVSPESVGNLRNIVISSLSGRSAMADKMAGILPHLDRKSPEVTKALNAVREKEALGYSYEDAEGSLALVIKDALGLRKNFFDLVHFKVMTDEDALTDAGNQAIDAMRSTAMIKVSVDGKEKLSAAEGNGPVNAMDRALRQVLSAFYPVIDKMKLTDFKVRVSSGGATASVVRVVIESTDGRSVWRTVGVSPDIINASWQALRDSVEYMLDMSES
ncbi:MAG: citramalate synthase [Ruminococcaceae bacterium]|nr:citramalate synthase [Oscillospiraceae bacterium]